MKRITSLFDQDSNLKEVLLNGPHHMQLVRSNHTKTLLKGYFPDQKIMSHWIQDFAYEQRIRLDPNCPAAGGYFFLNSHFRWYAVLPSISPSGPIISVRKQHFKDLSSESVFPELNAFIRSRALENNPTVIYGATGSGKTTCLLHLLRQLPEERIMILDSQLEFNLDDPNRIVFMPRPADSEGRGEYPIARLSKDILRLSPDRIVTAEVRGDEAGVFFQSLISGHRPPLCTLHAGTSEEVRDRLLMLAMAGGVDIEILRGSMKRTFNLIEMQGSPSPHVRSTKEIPLLA